MAITLLISFYIWRNMKLSKKQVSYIMYIWIFLSPQCIFWKSVKRIHFMMIAVKIPSISCIFSISISFKVTNWIILNYLHIYNFCFVLIIISWYLETNGHRKISKDSIVTTTIKKRILFTDFQNIHWGLRNIQIIIS